MKRKILFISLAILLTVGLLIIITNKNRKIYTEIDGIKYAILVNGQTSDSFPSGAYTADVRCTNSYAYWDNILGKVIIKNISGNVECEIEFTSVTNSDLLNSYLINLCNETTTLGTCSASTASDQGDGALVNENGLRFEGTNPNNYVWFNNELWRIIGVFSTELDSDDDSVVDTTGNLVKIIRTESLGGLSWNKSNTNDWPNSSLFNLLNLQYYDWSNNSSTVNTYCYGYSTTIPANCNYSDTGIKSGYRGMVALTNWYLGGGGKSGYTTYTPANIYSYERNANAIYTGRSASTSGYIGLMYESDYRYGVLASDCARTTTTYNTAACAGNNWLYTQGEEWTISPNSSASNLVRSIQDSGASGSNTNAYAYNGYIVRPVLYLLPLTYRVSGSGTITDPYIIGIPTSTK